MKTILYYFNEANVVALFAMITLAILVKIFIAHRDELTEHANHRVFQIKYSVLMGILSGLFVYIFLRTPPDSTVVESIGCGTLASFLVGFLFVIGMDRSHNYPWVLIRMGIKTLIPFAAIFALQSKWYYGVGLFLVIVIIPVGLVTLKDYFDWLAESTKVDEF